MRARLVLVPATLVALLVPATAAAVTPPSEETRLGIGPVTLVSPPGSDGPRERGYHEVVLSADGGVAVYLGSARGSGGVVMSGLVHWTDTATGVTTTVRGLRGRLPDGPSDDAVISGDGRWLAFQSSATNLVRGDENGVDDVFLHDTATGRTELVSRDRRGRPLTRESGGPQISADGSLITVTTLAKVSKHDRNRDHDVFALEVATGERTVLSVTPDGSVGNDGSGVSDLSPDGRFALLTSSATDLVDGDENEDLDVFLRDVQLGTTELVSVTTDGAQFEDYAIRGSMSDDARFIAFEVGEYYAGHGWTEEGQMMLRDRGTGTTRLVSHAHGSDLPADHRSTDATISGDGRTLAFRSFASDLVPGKPPHISGVFLEDVRTGRVVAVRAPDDIPYEEGGSARPALSGDGRVLGFETWGAWVPEDDESPDERDTYDVYVADVLR